MASAPITRRSSRRPPSDRLPPPGYGKGGALPPANRKKSVETASEMSTFTSSLASAESSHLGIVPSRKSQRGRWVWFSNSMIKSWWRCLKHQWLYLNALDSLSSLQRLVPF